MVRKLIVFYFFAIYYTFGQQIKFENLTTNQGLSNNSVIDIKNDKNGGLWIATWDGLNYYDGYNFKIFKNNPNNSKSISSNYIIQLEKDAFNQIWILTKEGYVNCYLGNNQFKEFKFNDFPTTIYLSHKGNIVVKTNNAYYEFRNKSFVKTSSNVVKKSDFNNLKNLLLAKYPTVKINDVLKDKLGNIWYATRENGLYIIRNTLDKSSIEHFSADLYSTYSFKSNEIETLHEDVFGNIWLGQKDGGLSMAYDGSEKINFIAQHPKEQPNLPAETIRAVTRDNNGKVWLGYYVSGLYQYNERTHFFEKFKIKEASLDINWSRIRTLFTASDGTVWAGTYKGLIRISGNSYTCYEQGKTPQMVGDRFYSIYEDQNAELWIAGWKGVTKFNLKTGKFEKFKGQELLQGYHFRCIKKDNEELVLATENNGVLVLNLKTNTLTKITTKNGILGNSIYSVFVDKQFDNYWIGSLGGVTVFNKKKGVLKNLTEAEGLPSHMIYGVLDTGDKVWVSTTKGIASIDKKEYKITSYNSNYIWQAPEFSEGAYYQDAQGFLYFGGVRGLNFFNAKNINSHHINAIIKLKIDGSENYSNEIKKSYTKNDLEIELVPIIFPRNKQNDIYYKLEGKDEDWISWNPANKIEYSGLSSGTYNFMVREGKNGTIQKDFFNLTITKAFYETIFFYVLLLVLTIIVCVIIIHIKNKKAVTQQKYLEKLVAARTVVIENQNKDLQEINKILDEKNKRIGEQKEKLLMLHSNFKDQNFEIEKFKSFMLTEFQEPISKIIKISGSVKKDSGVQSELIIQSGKLVKLISEWNYLEHVKQLGPVKKSAVSLFPILQNSTEKLKKDLQLNHVNFNCEIDNSPHFSAVDLLRLKLLLQYFFNDLSKYSDENSMLNIKIGYEKSAIKVAITSDSVILKNNWNKITKYSPYHKALQVLIDDLEAVFESFSEVNFGAILKIPIEMEESEMSSKQRISWRNFNYENELNSHKQNLLVFSDEFNYAVANQVLENDKYNIIFESVVSNLNALIKQINISTIVFYQTKISNELIHFLKENKEKNGLKLPLIYVSEEIDYELNEQLLEIGVYTHIQLPASTSFIQKKITNLIDQRNEPLNEYKIQQKMFEILSDESDIITSNEKLLKKALEIIKKELHDPLFNVEELAEELGISRVKCYRLFKETLNQSPSEILMSLRLQKAEVLLKTKKLNISEISFECGYNDPKYFGRSFKKYFGKSPKEYKEHSL